jgi:hypothetical protein
MADALMSMALLMYPSFSFSLYVIFLLVIFLCHLPTRYLPLCQGFWLSPDKSYGKEEKQVRTLTLLVSVLPSANSLHHDLSCHYLESSRGKTRAIITNHIPKS